jgi:hypothetical protein
MHECYDDLRATAIFSGQSSLKEKDLSGQKDNLIGQLPLPRRVAPQPWEDIASLIGRTACAMSYRHHAEFCVKREKQK